jgi:hypothetical protein
MSKRITSPDDAQKAFAHVTRPVKTPTEDVSEYARHRRDRARQDAGITIAKAEGEQRILTPTEEQAVEAKLTEAEKWAFRLEQTKRDERASGQRASVRREPLVYEAGAPVSYFRDLLAGEDDPDAVQRLARHAKQMKYETARYNERAKQAEQQSDGYEFRDQPSFAGQGTLAPPLYLVEDVALPPRAGRVFARNVTTLPLPDGVSSVRIPQIAASTGAVGPQAEGSAVAASEIADTETIAGVITVSGMVDISMQLLEQSKPGAAGIDRIIYRTLLNAYDEALEQQVIAGAGATTNGRQIEFTGVLNTSGITEVTATGTTAPATYEALGKAFGTLSKRRKLVPTGWYLNGDRWAWYGVSRDISGRPLTPPIDLTPPPAGQPVGGILGVPARVSEPVGDAYVIAARAEDSYLFEGQPRLATFTESLAGGLLARMRLHAYAAFSVRQPTSVAVVKGLPPVEWSES